MLLPVFTVDKWEVNVLMNGKKRTIVWVNQSQKVKWNQRWQHQVYNKGKQMKGKQLPFCNV